jgi:hypothetical protein
MKIKYKYILKNSISIHVRRGDYLSEEFKGLLKNKEYYYNEIKKIDNQKNITNILVFSDDIQWCKENIIDKRIIYIEGQKDYEDLYLMSLCENNISSQSSFSWWAEFLNKNKK